MLREVARMTLLWTVLGGVGCRPSASVDTSVETPPDESVPAELFRNVTADWGVDFVHQALEHEPIYFMPRSIGSGAALFDFDGDGWLDLYLIQNGGKGTHITNRLYRQVNGRFVDVSSKSGLDVDGAGMGVACGDFNNDGRVDVFVTEYGSTRLFVNRTTGDRPQFDDITNASGIDNRLWGTSTCCLDYDRDGWLDLVLVNYLNYDPSRWCADGSSSQEFCGPDNFPGCVAKLFRNLGADRSGADPRFEDVTVSSGLGAQPGPGLGVFCADFDGDRWPDILVANDGHPNYLWMNQRNGTFKEEATSRGLAYNSMGRTEANMGIAVGDVDTDGLFDLLVTHLSEETHTLWSQEAPGLFIDKTAVSGISASKWRGTGFGTTLADVDNDGDLDLAIANGRVTRASGRLPTMEPGLAKFWWPYAQRDQLFLNGGQGRFEDGSEGNPALSGLAGVSRGLACGDINRDGALDLVVTRIAGPPAVLLNRSAGSGSWLRVRAFDPRWNRDAYGAEVWVTVGDKTVMRWANPGYSFLCSNEPVAHFGLGTNVRVDRVEIVWPDGVREVFPGGEVNRHVTLRRGEGETVSDG